MNVPELRERLLPPERWGREAAGHAPHKAVVIRNRFEASPPADAGSSTFFSAGGWDNQSLSRREHLQSLLKANTFSNCHAITFCAYQPGTAAFTRCHRSQPLQATTQVLTLRAERHLRALWRCSVLWKEEKRPFLRKKKGAHLLGKKGEKN